ncbi:AAA family ATPase [Flammeovirga yaeyamensis]|uniref:AAA family ATPase n=1 Tax=Flammeovirga yaeyamensis TaxID=367791 RepID=A0AAX1N3Y4_9BACT|nr:ATP-binding protein [Flammeovirga yaeyamensis]MBB3695940.1 AAA+ superfamily predicted ATPase [Flammeovirga yaeyamensis]NMF34628.1 AAA family ATPase [Flammeovirga yaeyamensis]QWG00543.1 AAA family ATPase [Flammeovirga yaeyamensis]
MLTLQLNKTALIERCEILNEWLEKFIQQQISSKENDIIPNRDTFHFPPLIEDSNLKDLVDKYELSQEEELLLLFAYMWEAHPELFVPFLVLTKEANGRAILGGTKDKHTNLFVPTLRTFFNIFLNSSERDPFFLKLSSPEFPLIRDGVLKLDKNGNDERFLLDQSIRLTTNFRNYLLGGNYPSLDHEIDFPARLYQSKLSYDDVILSQETLDELKVLERILEVKPKLKNLPDIQKRVNTNHIIVFSGPPGTGKSLTATTLGNKYNMDTYVLDLSRVLSRYVGDFEKAMEKVFLRLENQNCILFIDEADSIFTKRNEDVKEAKDKYSNQEMSYLLQRLEKFDGIVILASNVKDIRSHVDKAMMRRISHIMEFPFPLESERKILWEKALPPGFNYDENVLETVSRNYQLSGANIASVISNTLLEAIHKDTNCITLELIKPIIQREFYKRDSRFMECPDNSPGAILMEQRLGRDAVHNGRRM